MTTHTLQKKSLVRKASKAVSLCTITALLATMMIWPNPASAQETPRGPQQPFLHGYNAKQMKEWTPESDPYAKYMRSRVPLAQRIQPFQPTQAHPELTTTAQVMNLSADYDKEEWFEGYRYNDSFSRNVLKNWQYQDIYASWHGLPIAGSPTEEGRRDYGVVNIPNPAYTDAAHRNGVISLGGWFWPRNINFAELVEKTPDGKFPVADKMIEMAKYFGFDGYFINQEATISKAHADLLMEMLKYMRAQGMYLSWYDSLTIDGKISYVNGFNEKNSPWLKDERDGKRANDSIFMNYAYTPEGLESSADHARKLGIDPYASVFAGIENDKFRFDRGLELEAIFRNDAARSARTSVALFGTDMVWNKGPNPFDLNTQSYVEQREQAYWSGPLGNPAESGRAVGTEYESWPGIAHYISERSVVGSYPFVTRFNNGHGLDFFMNGQKSSDAEWNNMAAQDILPTWQWWTKSAGKALAAGYDYTTAWNGGSSLKIEGTLNKNNATDIHLYKTDLPVTKDVQLSVTYKANGNVQQGAAIQALLSFKDDPKHPVAVNLNGGLSEQWSTATADLKSFEGRTIAAISLRVSSQSNEDALFKANIGELKLTNKKTAQAPAAPTGFQVEKAMFDDQQAAMYVKWAFNDKQQDVWYYDLMRVVNGKRESIGRIYDEVYYLKSLPRSNETDVKLELSAVGKDGTASAPQTISWKWGSGERVNFTQGPIAATSIEAMHLTGDKLNMETGWTDTINIRVMPSTAANVNVTWTSSNEAVAKVDARGKVTAVGAGDAILTAQTGAVNGQPGIKRNITVKVVESVKAQGGVVLEAEKYNDSNGLFKKSGYVNVRDLNFADWMSFKDVDFGDKGATKLTVRAAVLAKDTRMEVRLGGATGQLVADVALPVSTRQLAPFYKNYTVDLSAAVSGQQQVHITFKNPNYRSWTVRDTGIVDVDWLQFQ
ncbi:carbohydrate-binding protein [Paenibacillus sp. UMB4589-SE434]|uniref:endo-beta-N-acetylglucosaminidase n=1 Tax=Paenibacillus sp. UMB4589-SE434 TaxID=3046314 RepID=UPI00254E465C|nr:carbohydrate-binding protein [Paenibacillus sp. UMB4589-SE434]MDK8183593.1 carbohydrate-binding protein [Paenibacillus sp. UMB4589-SE434]